MASNQRLVFVHGNAQTLWHTYRASSIVICNQAFVIDAFRLFAANLPFQPSRRSAMVRPLDRWTRCGLGGRPRETPCVPRQRPTRTRNTRVAGMNPSRPPASDRPDSIALDPTQNSMGPAHVWRIHSCARMRSPPSVYPQRQCFGWQSCPGDPALAEDLRGVPRQ